MHHFTFLLYITSIYASFGGEGGWGRGEGRLFKTFWPPNWRFLKTILRYPNKYDSQYYAMVQSLSNVSSAYVSLNNLRYVKNEN